MDLFSVIGLIGFSAWSFYGFSKFFGKCIAYSNEKRKVHFGYAALVVLNLIGAMFLPVTCQLIAWHGITSF
jgi:hypothetical protein